MTQYIDKSAVVAKMEEWRDNIKKNIILIPLSGKDKAYSSYEYEILGKVITFLEIFEVKDSSFEKFKSLQHISRDLRSTLQDWGYAPNLYHFDGSWHVDWIHCEKGDSIEGFTAETPEEAIDKAYNWFHSKFCNG